MDYRIRLWQLAILAVFGSILAKRPYTIELDSFNCVIVAPTAVTELKCIIHKKILDPRVSVHFTLRETAKHFKIVFHLDVLKKDNSKMNLAHVQLDGCNYLSSVYSNNIFGRYFKRVRDASNLPKNCPVSGNKPFHIHNYTVIADELPLAVPALSYQLRLSIMKADDVIADILVEGKIIY